MADVARGDWRPPEPPPPSPGGAPTFHEFSETWWTLNERQRAPKTVRDYRWKLEEHLLGAFGEQLLHEITIADVERYAAELKAGKLSPRSINATITLHAQILDAAVDRELVGRNVARGRGRKVRERAPARSYLETAGQIEALLDAAGRLDHEAREGHAPSSASCSDSRSRAARLIRSASASAAMRSSWIA
jgi:hypothetical protein